MSVCILAAASLFLLCKSSPNTINIVIAINIPKLVVMIKLFSNSFNYLMKYISLFTIIISIAISAILNLCVLFVLTFEYEEYYEFFTLLKNAFNLFF